MISQSRAGSTANRVSGAPEDVRRGLPPSWTVQSSTIQALSSHPLTSDQRPLTRKPPATASATPEARVLLAVTTSALPWMDRAASGGSWAMIQCVLPFQTHQATDASKRASSSSTSRPCVGVRSSPP